MIEEVFPGQKDDDVSAGLLESSLEGLEKLCFFVVRKEDHLEREIRSQVEDPVDARNGQKAKYGENQESMPEDAAGQAGGNPPGEEVPKGPFHGFGPAWHGGPRIPFAFAHCSDAGTRESQ